MSIDWYYPTKLQEIQTTFCKDLEELFINHVNWIIRKYGGWKRYPRKEKKLLKNKGWWKLKNLSPFQKSDIKVNIKNYKGEECKLGLDFPEPLLDDVRSEVCKKLGIPKEIIK